ncbi:50S ribosomal protein L9 [Candidatus Kaiserbacteria bacterium]|nr:50S ribosomal protein L9 [Candidatus Kaiserbacteria bacterium]
MKVILLQDVGGVGKRHEVKDVADGHALNFLIPRGLAEQATKEKLAAHEKRIADLSAKMEREEATLKETVQHLRGTRIEIAVRATEKGGLFKTIGPKEIAAALKEQKEVTLPMEAIKPLEPVKTTGDHIIKISAAGAESEMMLKIVAA